MNDMNNAQDNSVKPKIWKLILIALVFYLTMNVDFFLIGDFLFTIPQLIRILFLAIIFVLLFDIGIPTLHKKFYKWTIK